jgi:hypothetical protein
MRVSASLYMESGLVQKARQTTYPDLGEDAEECLPTNSDQSATYNPTQNH